jgi:acid phosphatase (class A)
MLANDGSYPSGHTAIGWTWALILAGLAPDRADEILERGIVFGDSRAVCNVHWPSDVVAGRTMGAAAFAVLQSNADYNRDLEFARRELETVRAAGRGPDRDCAVEAQAMNSGSASALFE